MNYIVFTDLKLESLDPFVLRDDNSNDLLNGNLIFIQNWKKVFTICLYDREDVNVRYMIINFIKK